MNISDKTSSSVLSQRFFCCFFFKPCICFCLQLEKDERSDEESDVEEEEDNNGRNVDQGGDHCWERSKDKLNSQRSMLTNNCVLNNLTNHRESVADKMRKAD